MVVKKQKGYFQKFLEGPLKMYIKHPLYTPLKIWKAAAKQIKKQNV